MKKILSLDFIKGEFNTSTLEREEKVDYFETLNEIIRLTNNGETIPDQLSSDFSAKMKTIIKMPKEMNFHGVVHLDYDLFFEFVDGENHWFIQSTEQYWFWSSRNGKDYVEIVHWFNSRTQELKETKRQVSDNYGNHHSLPDWAKHITTHNKKFDHANF